MLKFFVTGLFVLALMVAPLGLAPVAAQTVGGGSTMSISQLLVIIQALQVQLNALIARLAELQLPEPVKPTVCSADARMCPDGSYVSRTGPNCEFAACPVIVTPIEPSITIISPNGEESYVAGRETITVKWRSYGLTYNPSYRISLYSPVAGDVAAYQSSPPESDNSSYYQFLIPSTITTGKYKINVCVLNTERADAPGKNLCDSSDNYFTITSGAVANKPPVISGLMAPTSLKIGDTGTWIVKAYDPEGGPLTYTVNWGEPQLASLASSPREEIYQTSTFTHVYNSIGTYRVTIVIRDQAGAEVTTSATVTVMDSTPVLKASLMVTVLNGDARCITYPCEVPLLTSSVSLYNATTGAFLGSRTTTKGYALFTDLEPGIYRAVASDPGFSTKNEGKISLVSSQNGSLKITLVNYITYPTTQKTVSATGRELAAVLQSLQGVLNNFSYLLSR